MAISATSLREMPEEDRPRERLARVGPEALRDAELLAVLFRTGTREEGAIALAERVLRHFNHSLRTMGRASLEEIMQVKGVGKVKAIEIKAAMELGRRLAERKAEPRRKITSAVDIADLLMLTFKEYEIEHFKCVLLNVKQEVLKVVDVSRGSLTGTLVEPGDVFRQAVREGATGLILAHNHPSGDPEPSRMDIELTQRLVESGRILGISVLDHVIFGDKVHVSLKERGWM